MSGTISALLPSRFIRPPPSVALKSDRDELSCAMELMGNINISIKSKANFPPIVPNAFYKVFMASQVKLMHIVLKPLSLYAHQYFLEYIGVHNDGECKSYNHIIWRKKLVKILRFLLSLKRPGGIQRRPGTRLAYP